MTLVKINISSDRNRVDSHSLKGYEWSFVVRILVGGYKMPSLLNHLKHGFVRMSAILQYA